MQLFHGVSADEYASFLVDVPQKEIEKVGAVYPEDPTLASIMFCSPKTVMISYVFLQGSPYDVGMNDTITWVPLRPIHLLFSHLTAPSINGSLHSRAIFTSKSHAVTPCVIYLGHRMFGVTVCSSPSTDGYMLNDSLIVWKRNKYVPIIGSFHGSDLQEFYNLTGSIEWAGTDAIGMWHV